MVSIPQHFHKFGKAVVDDVAFLRRQFFQAGYKDALDDCGRVCDQFLSLRRQRDQNNPSVFQGPRSRHIAVFLEAVDDPHHRRRMEIYTARKFLDAEGGAVSSMVLMVQICGPVRPVSRFTFCDCSLTT